MKFIKFFHLDFRRGMHTVWRLYLCGAALFALLCLDFWNRSRIFWSCILVHPAAWEIWRCIFLAA